MTNPSKNQNFIKKLEDAACALDTSSNPEQHKDVIRLLDAIKIIVTRMDNHIKDGIIKDSRGAMLVAHNMIEITTAPKIGTNDEERLKAGLIDVVIPALKNYQDTLASDSAKSLTPETSKTIKDLCHFLTTRTAFQSTCIPQR